MTTYDTPTLDDYADSLSLNGDIPGSNRTATRRVTAGTHRRNDPPSSVAAAKAVKPTKAHRAILEAFKANGGRGTLDTACAALPKLLRSSVSRRITDLREMGDLRPTGEMAEGGYSMPVAVWEVVR